MFTSNSNNMYATSKVQPYFCKAISISVRDPFSYSYVLERQYAFTTVSTGMVENGNLPLQGDRGQQKPPALS